MATSDDGRRVRDRSEVLAHAGRTVRVEGIYQPVDVRRHQVPPPVFAGHAALVLADGTRVLLGAVWDPASRRSEDEHARLDGRRVVAIGTMRPLGMEPPGGGAVPQVPCLHPLEEVAALPEVPK